MGTGAGPNFGRTKGNNWKEQNKKKSIEKERKFTSEDLIKNAKEMKDDFKLLGTGYFGIKAKTSVRHIASEEPVKTANQFFDELTRGGTFEKLDNGKGKLVKTSDGYTITIREISSSKDHSPAVDINVRKNKTDEIKNIKSQKIHFIKEIKKQ